MGYFLTAESVLSGIGEKCLERLNLFFLRASPTTPGEWLSPTVTDQGGYSPIRGIREKTKRIETIGRFAWLSFRCCARCGHQFPRAHKFVVCVHEYTNWEAMNSSVTGTAVLILILHVDSNSAHWIPHRRKKPPHRNGSIDSGLELRGLHFAARQMIPCGSILRRLMRKGKLWRRNWKAKLGW